MNPGLDDEKPRLITEAFVSSVLIPKFLSTLLLDGDGPLAEALD